jgi:TolB-like protein/tetratricopeptide (TPR) repeat protein
LKSEPVPPSQLNSEIPKELERTILNCLEKDPTLRYQSASGVLADLKRVQRDLHANSSGRGGVSVQEETAPKRRSFAGSRVGVATGLAAVVGVAVIVGSVWLMKGRAGQTGRTSGPVSPSEKRIAVLPFENLGATEDAYFADGMTDEVRSKLTGLPGLAVIARASSNQYKATTKPPREIARVLDVRYLLTATVRWQKSGGTSRIRLSPEVVEIVGDSAPTTRWQQTFDADLADVFEVQGRIATQVAQALRVTLGATQTKRLEEPATSNLIAYEAYLKGREIEDRGFDPTHMRQAGAHFEQAVALDPGFAKAWARLSLTRTMAYSNGVPSPELGNAALSAAEKAFALSPQVAESYLALGAYHRAVSRDRVRAVEVLRRGLDMAPDNVDLLRNLGYAEQERGRLEEALAAVRRATSLDPQSWANQLSLAEILSECRRPREARSVADHGLALNPVQLELISRKVITYLQEGDLAGAQAAIASVPKEVEPTALVSYFASQERLAWAMNASQRELLLRLTPSAFDDDRARWANALATEHRLRGHVADTRKAALEAQEEYVKQLAAAPDDPYVHAAFGTVLALLGKREAAVREGERAVRLARIDVEENWALYSLSLTHTRLGNTEPAIEALERLLKVPNWVTSGWLRLDTNFDPLRGHARFEKLAQQR